MKRLEKLITEQKDNIKTMQDTMKKIIDYLHQNEPMKSTFFGDKEDIKKLIKESPKNSLAKFISTINRLESETNIDPKSTTTILNPITAKYLASQYPSFDEDKDGLLTIKELKKIIQTYKSEVSKKVGDNVGGSKLNSSNAFMRWATDLWNLEGGDEGLVNVKHDLGGKTNAGITYKTFKSLAPQALGIEGSLENLRNLTKEQWFKFVKYWWNQNGGKDINNKAVAAFVVDTIWGSGPTGVCKVIQPVLIYDFGKDGITADCNLGPKTIAAINEIPDQGLLFNKLTNRRKKFMDEIVQSRPEQSKFHRGWHNRIDHLYNMFT